MINNLAKLPQKIFDVVSGAVQKKSDARPEYDEIVTRELNLFTDEEIESDKYRVFDPDLSLEEGTKINKRAKELRQQYRS